MFVKRNILIASLVFIVLILLSIFLIKAISPKEFPVKTIYTIEENTGLTNLSVDLVNKNIIKSAFLFKSFSVLFGGTKGILAGDYNLNERQTVFTLAWRMSTGDFHLTPVKVLIREGLNVFEIAEILSSKFEKVEAEEFVALANSSEGYLFPDTYFFLPNVTAKQILKEMRGNFDLKIKDIENDLLAFNRSYSDIIKMASIVEKEAMTSEQKRLVAGILWNRLDQGMPLQVDASFKYINGKITENLTLTDLKIDSPYNSYLYKGLPPTPISNPGLQTILATINPEKTNYLYFLSDDDFNMYYSETYAEHLQKKGIYLR